MEPRLSLKTLALILLCSCTGSHSRNTLEFGAPCSTDDECSSGMCEPTDGHARGDPPMFQRCTQRCDPSDPCPSGYCGEEGVCVLGPPAIEKISVAILHRGTVEGLGWTTAHEDSREYLQEVLEVETAAAFSLSPDEVREQIEIFIDEHYNVIVGTSQDYVEAIRDASDQHRNVRFLTCSGFEHGPNFGSYSGRMYQVMYLLGTVAGSVTQTNTVGVVGSVAIPETVLNANAFTQGVKSVNPDALVIVDWLGAWYSTSDPPEENDIVDDLVMLSGVDVVLYTTDILSRLSHICEMQDGEPTNGEFPEGTPTVYAFGWSWYGGCNECPDYCLMTAAWNWAPLLEEIIEDMSRDEWLPSLEPWSPVRVRNEESIAFYTSLYSDITSLYDEAGARELMEALAGSDGLYLPFAGTVVDAEGNERFISGEQLDDDDLLRMCWYVDGLADNDGEPNRVPRECLEWGGED